MDNNEVEGVGLSVAGRTCQLIEDGQRAVDEPTDDAQIMVQPQLPMTVLTDSSQGRESFPARPRSDVLAAVTEGAGVIDQQDKGHGHMMAGVGGGVDEDLSRRAQLPGHAALTAATLARSCLSAGSPGSALLG
nr:hypothetical protein [Humibacillus xanthopallidus]